MKAIKIFMLFVACVFTFSSCISAAPENAVKLTEDPSSYPSPFNQFENLENSTEVGIDGEQVDNLLRTYNIYEKVIEKAIETGNAEAHYSDMSISVFSIGSGRVAVLHIVKGHLHIYIMFSRFSDEWMVDGFTCLNERINPEYRIEQSGDGSKYWLVIKYESNHGTGLQIFNEAWYNPDGTIAADYPAEGFIEFFPQVIKPSANAKFSVSANYDGGSNISLYYSISFIYHYEENNSQFSRFRCEYNPVIREHWEYNINSQQLDFITSDPALPEGMVNHDLSADIGILQGYIDYYRTRLGNKAISTLEEWERFIRLNE